MQLLRFVKPPKCSLEENLVHIVSQIRYKEAVKAELAHPVYHQLPDTLETQFARELTDMQSNVRPAPLRRTTSFLPVLAQLTFARNCFYSYF